MNTENEVTFLAIKAELNVVLTLLDGRTVEINVPQVQFSDGEGFSFTEVVEDDDEEILGRRFLRVEVEGQLIPQEDGGLYTFEVEE